MRRLSIGVALVGAVGAGNVAFAQSRCDSTITRAAGKKVACKAGVVSKAQKSGGTPDGAKLAKCEAKFAKACGNGQAAGGCVVQTGSCAGIEATVDACVTTLMGNAAPTTTTTTITATTTTTSTTIPLVPCTGGSGYPTCDGSCDAGLECHGYFDLTDSVFTCACFPVGSTPCDPGQYPQCGGLVCPGNRVCSGFADALNPSSRLCGCVDPSQTCSANPDGSCVHVGYCQAPDVCVFSELGTHANCPCCGCQPPP